MESMEKTNVTVLLNVNERLIKTSKKFLKGYFSALHSALLNTTKIPTFPAAIQTCGLPARLNRTQPLWFKRKLVVPS